MGMRGWSGGAWLRRSSDLPKVKARVKEKERKVEKEKASETRPGKEVVECGPVDTGPRGSRTLKKRR